MPIEELDLTGMRLESVAWHGEVLRVSFGRGYAAKAVVGDEAGLHTWSLHSGGVWPNTLDMLTIESVSRFEYYWNFFRRHTTGENTVFVLQWRGGYYHAEFVETEMSVDKFKNVLLYEGGVQIRQARLIGSGYLSDGSLDTTAPTTPGDFTAEAQSSSVIRLRWSSATDPDEGVDGGTSTFTGGGIDGGDAGG